VLTFGIVASLQIFLKNRTGYLVSRLILGFCESGYIPGAIYTLSTWYTKKELARRVAILFFGMFGANAISPLLATGILKLEGARGLRGWQWLFLGNPPPGNPLRSAANTPLVEGLFTILVSIILIFFLPGSPQTPRPLLSAGIIRFSDPESDLLRRRLENDDPEGHTPGAQGMHIPLALVWKTVSHYRRWPHYVSTFAVFSNWAALTTYTPSIMVLVCPH
jgi:MFS family permease